MKGNHRENITISGSFHPVCSLSHLSKLIIRTIIKYKKVSYWKTSKFAWFDRWFGIQDISQKRVFAQVFSNKFWTVVRSVIVRVSVVLKRTVVGDRRFDNLCGSHLQSQGFKPFTLLSFELFAKFLIVILHNNYKREISI